MQPDISFFLLYIFCHCFLYKHPQEIGLHHLKPHNNRCTALFLGFVASPFLINWVNLEALPNIKTNVISASYREAIFFSFFLKNHSNIPVRQPNCAKNSRISLFNAHKIILSLKIITQIYVNINMQEQVFIGLESLFSKAIRKSIHVLHNKIITWTFSKLLC